jgi:hypothetical protein
MIEKATGARLYSGMVITETPQRELLGEILSQAYSEWYTSFGRAQYVAEANAIAQTVGEVDGITIVEPGDYGQDYSNRCAHFAFGTKHGQPWAQPHTELDDDIWLNSRGYLRRSGYDVMEFPLAGDVAAYAFKEHDAAGAGQENFKHFGIVEPDGSLLSKFNQGPVVNHPIETVPTNYGNVVYFLGNRACAKF